MSDQVYRLLSTDLLCKWGFSDGFWQAPEDLENMLRDEGFTPYDERSVRTLVRRYLVPEVEKHHTLELFEIPSHNPIRAKWVDGVEIENFRDAWQHWTLQPEYVEVTYDQILEVWRDDHRDPS